MNILDENFHSWNNNSIFDSENAPFLEDFLRLQRSSYSSYGRDVKNIKIQAKLPEGYVIEPCTIYNKPCLESKNKEDIEKIMSLGSEKRNKNLDKTIYQKAYEELKGILDPNGRIAIGIPRKLSIHQQLSDFSVKYDLKITYKDGDEKPYIDSGNKSKENLIRCLKKDNRNLNKVDLRNINNEELTVIVDFFTNNKELQLPQVKRELFQGKDRYEKKIYTVLQKLVSTQIIYNYCKTNFLRLQSDVSSTSFQKLIKDCINKFEDIIKNIDHTLSRNKTIKDVEGDEHDYDQLIFSINPYDIAMMSTQKSWESCTAVKGEHFDDIQYEIGFLSIIVYGTKNGDLDNPVNRILLKPYIGRNGGIHWYAHDTYGMSDNGLIQQVNKIADKLFNGDKETCSMLTPDIYGDEYPDYFLNNNYSEDDALFLLKNTDVKEEDLHSFLKKFPTHLEIQELAINKDPYAIEYIEDPSVKIQELAINKDPYAIEYIEDPSVKIQELAINKDPNAIVYIKDPLVEIQELAINKDPNAIQYIKDPSVKIQELEINKDPNAIQYIKDPSVKIQELAINKDPNAIQYIKDPCKTLAQILFEKYTKNRDLKDLFKYVCLHNQIIQVYDQENDCAKTIINNGGFLLLD